MHGGGVVRDEPPEVRVDLEVVRNVAGPARRLLHILCLVYLHEVEEDEGEEEEAFEFSAKIFVVSLSVCACACMCACMCACVYVCVCEGKGREPSVCKNITCLQFLVTRTDEVQIPSPDGYGHEELEFFFFSFRRRDMKPRRQMERRSEGGREGRRWRGCQSNTERHHGAAALSRWERGRELDGDPHL